jgi:hypothetical protein
VQLALLSPLFLRAASRSSRLLPPNAERRIHGRLREMAREERNKEKLFPGARAQVRPTFLLRGSARERSGVRSVRSLAPWAEGRGPDEENEEDERPERGTDRSARERNPRLPWLPSHSRLASLPWRRRHPVPLPHLSSLFVLPLSPFACSHARRTRSRLRNSVLLALGRQSSLQRRRR